MAPLAVAKIKIAVVAKVGLTPPQRPRVRLAIEHPLDLSSMEVLLQPNYYDGFTTAQQRSRRLKVDEYLRSADVSLDNLMCVEMPLPNVAAGKMQLHVRRGPSERTAVCLFHAGRSGSIAPLHYDWDHKWVLHVCLTGRKAFYLLPPEAGWLLNPVINTSSICVPRLADRDRHDLLRRLGGIEVRLAAGEAVLFPSLWWHAVRYEAPSTSISVRFGEQQALRPFGAMPRSFWLQRLVWELFRRDGCHDQPRRALQRCLAAFFKRGHWTKRYEEANATYRQILREMGGEYGAEYLASRNFNSEISIAGAELADSYGLNTSRGSPILAHDSLEDIRGYLFERAPKVPYNMQRKLARYAATKRQGLRPRRGVILVQRIRKP